MVLVLPIAVWEFSFGVYMTARGFRPVPEAAEASFAINVDVTPALVA